MAVWSVEADSLALASEAFKTSTAEVATKLAAAVDKPPYADLNESPDWVARQAVEAFQVGDTAALRGGRVELSTCPGGPGGNIECFVQQIEDEGGSYYLIKLVSPEAEESRDSHSSPSTDIVTGLPDRRALQAELGRRFGVKSRPFALLFLDLDGFKRVNDSHGHLVGDDTLREVATRFRAALRDQDFIARFGGDEFAIIAGGVTTLLEADPIVRRLEAAAEEPLTSAGSGRVSASVGVALSVDGYDSPQAMLQAADEGMYARKRAATSPSSVQ